MKIGDLLLSWIALSFLLPLVQVVGDDFAGEEDQSGEEYEEEEEEEEEEVSEYFYLPEKGCPVIEFEAPANNRNDFPDFLYHPKDTEVRIVEFYAHW